MQFYGMRSLRQLQAAISFTAASALLCVFLLHDSDHSHQSLESSESQVHAMDVNGASYKSNHGWIDGAGKLGFGPYYYGDTKIYGGQLDSNGNDQPYPLYQNIQVDASSGDSVVLNKPDGYDAAFLKDYYSFFDPKDRVEPPPDPVEAGYWPYVTADGLVASGGAGEAGAALRDWAAAERAPEPGPAAAAWAGDADGAEYRAERDAYIADEADAAYASRLRFYTDDWP